MNEIRVFPLDRTLRLSRWLREAQGPTIEQAAELAATLADLPADPKSV